MEIAPIPGIRDYTAAKAPVADFQLSAVVNLEAVVRTDHSAKSAARKKAAGAEEELDTEEQAVATDAPEIPEDPLQPHISFFA